MEYVKLNKSYRSLSDDNSPAPLLEITKVTHDTWAKQITLIEISLFKAIQREEFVSLKWNGKEKHSFAPNIVASTRWFNQTNFWVQKEVLKYTQVAKRAEMLSFFIKIAKKLVDYNNLYSAMAIVSALQVECIYRLRHTWERLTAKDRAAYRRLEELFSQEDNCRRQREHMNSIILPGIPYLGVYLSDLTYTNLAHPRIGGKPSAAWVSKINAIIDNIAYFQQSEYPFVLDESVNAYLCAQRYIEELQKFIEEDNYRTSLCLEPPPSPSAAAPAPIPVDNGALFYSTPVEKRGSTASLLSRRGQDKSADRYTSSPFKLSLKPLSSRKGKLSAADNSSFDCDFETDLTHSCAKLDTPVDLNCSAAAAAAADASLTQPKYKVTDETDAVWFSKRNTAGLSEHSALVSNGKAELSPGEGLDKNLTEMALSKRIGNGISQTHLDQLPPIPPRPATTEIDSKSDRPRSPHSVHNSNTTKVSECPGVLDELAVNFESHSLSSQTLTAEETDGCLTDATIFAVSGAICAKDSCDPLCFRSNGAELSNALSKEYPPVPCASSSQVSKPSHHRRSASIPVTLPSFETPSPPNRCLDVTILFQGPVYRRTLTVVGPTNKPSTMTSWLSPRSRVHQSSSIHYDSQASLSALSTDQAKSTLALARPTGFSSWRRLWASLVLIGNGSAAYVLYFEAQNKHASLRSQFNSHHCQIHCLSSNSTDPKLGARSESHQANDREQPAADPSSSSSRPTMAIVDTARHRDGAIDPHSFILTDPARAKLYQFRPVVVVEQTNRRRTLTWLRRTSSSATQATRVKPFDCQTDPSLLTPDAVVHQWIQTIRGAISRVRGFHEHQQCTNVSNLSCL